MVIEGTFKVVVRRFHAENAERKEKLFSTVEKCQGRIQRIKTLVRVYERYFLYPNIVATVTVFLKS